MALKSISSNKAAQARGYTGSSSGSSKKTATTTTAPVGTPVGISGVSKSTVGGKTTYTTPTGGSYVNLASALRAKAIETRGKVTTPTTTTPTVKTPVGVQTGTSKAPVGVQTGTSKAPVGVQTGTSKAPVTKGTIVDGKPLTNLTSQVNDIMSRPEIVTEADISGAFVGGSQRNPKLYSNLGVYNILRKTGAKNIQDALAIINKGKTAPGEAAPVVTDPMESKNPDIQEFYDVAAEQKDDVQDVNRDFNSDLTRTADTIANQIGSSFGEQANIIKRRGESAANNFSALNAKIAELSQATNAYEDAGVTQRASALASKMAAEGLLSGDQAQALSATLISDQSSIANLKKLEIAKEVAQMQIDVMQEYEDQKQAIMQQEGINENAKLQAVDALQKYYGDIIKRYQDFTNNNLNKYNDQVIAPTQTAANAAAQGQAQTAASVAQFGTIPAEAYTDPDVRYNLLASRLRDDKNISGMSAYTLPLLSSMKNDPAFLAKDIDVQLGEIITKGRDAMNAYQKSLS